MTAALLGLVQSASPSMRRRVALMGALLVAANLLVWVGVAAASRTFPVLLGLAGLAYGFGLRHAVDPDHIAAIDNTTRTLMQDGKRPLGVGLFFSLGHSTIVVALSAAVALSASFVHRNLPRMEATGSIVGTSVSALFLLVIGAINLVVLVGLIRLWRSTVSGGTPDTATLESYLQSRGLIARLLRPVLAAVRHSWQMYFVGLLFGLGFDTASEVGLLSISGVTGASGMPFWAVMLLPLAFTAGMALVDTLDGVLMLAVYGWAFLSPVRKLYYNMTITFISVLIAVCLGAVEALQVIGDRTGAQGGIWSVINRLTLDAMGFYIIGGFVAAWLCSMLIYRVRRYDQLAPIVLPRDEA